MTQFPRHWVLSVLRRLLLDNPLVRHSIRGLLTLFCILRRRFTRTQSSEKGPCGPSSPSIHYSPPRTDVYPNDITIGDGPQPQLQPPPPGGSIISPSRVPHSLRPYSFSGPHASCSSQNLEMLPMQENDLRDVSRHSLCNSPTPPEAFTRSPSPNLAPSLQSVDIPVPPLTASPASSVILPNPDGEVADISRPELSSEYPDIFAIAPSHFERYERNITIDREYHDLMIEPLTMSFTPANIPAGWTSFTHPEGALYFFHKQKKILTEADMYDRRVRSDLITFIGQIEDFIRAHNIQIGPDVELVLDKRNYDDRVCCGYYFADHQSRSVFWLDKFDASNFQDYHETPGVSAIIHLKHEVESQYWYHCELFPHTRDVSKKLVNELRDLIVHAIGDVLTSKTSTAPYGAQDFQAMLNLVDSSEKNIGTRLGGSACILSRLMHTIVRVRFINFHGQPCARLCRDQVIYKGGVINRSYLIMILSPILFSAPDVHLRTLKKLWTDQIVHTTTFNEVISRLNDEWQEFTLYGTVLLNANVAFLAIQSVDSDGDTPHRSPAQIASYLSIVTSIGGIILGLLLVRQNRTKARDTAEDAMRFLQKRNHPTLGLETLAIMYSLPYALLMWAMVSFLAAFSLMCIQATNLITRLLVGTGWFAVAILITWCVWSAWESQEEEKSRWSLFVEAWKGLTAKLQSEEKPVDKTPKKRWLWPLIFGRRSSWDSSATVV